jgi:hypothetical protein
VELSVAVTVKLKVASATVLVPESRPVFWFSVMPVGRAPAVTVYL